MSVSQMQNNSQPIRRFVRSALWWPRRSWNALPSLEEEVWRQQNDEICKTIWNTTTLLVGASLFCLFVLGAPDASLISNDAKITVPIISITASYSDFLLFAPLFLVGLTLYLHVFIEERLRLGDPVESNRSIKRKPLSPLIFNLDLPVASLLSAFLFYGMLPCVLGMFALKTLPRPKPGMWLVTAFVAVCIWMLALKIRRFPVEHTKLGPTPTRLLSITLRIFLYLFILSLSPLVWLTGKAFLMQLRSTPGNVTQVPSPSLPIFRARRLQLFGAALDRKDLSGLYAPFADLRKANLREADMEGANLAHADLRKADLPGANLTSADLRFGRLEGADLTNAKLEGTDLRQVTSDETTKIDPKWWRVICIGRGDLSKSCVQSLAWTDLSRAKLLKSDLHEQQMTGTDLSYSDLTGANLAGTILRAADLRHALLPASIKDAILDGALTSGQSGLPPSGVGTAVSIKNRGTEACLEAPLASGNGNYPYMAYPCAQAGDPFGALKVRRLENGFFVFGSQRTGQSICLDHAPTKENRPGPHMWQCNDDYDTQYWHVIATKEGFVHLVTDTGLCLDGTSSRDGLPNPILTACSGTNHSQGWDIIYPTVPDSARAALAGDELRRKRAQDLQITIQSYQNSPSGAYGSSSRSGEFRRPVSYARGFDRQRTGG